MQTDVIMSLVMRINISIFPGAPEISTAASLAHQGLLDSVKDMYLKDEDLASVPAEHLASLAACVTERVIINNVSNCDLISILDNVKCPDLYISNQTLSSEETRALVRAMEAQVEVVSLGNMGEVILDIKALTQYSGQGKCNWLEYDNDNAYTYTCSEELRSWAEKINWRVSKYDGDFFVVWKEKNI